MYTFFKGTCCINVEHARKRRGRDPTQFIEVYSSDGEKNNMVNHYMVKLPT